MPGAIGDDDAKIDMELALRIDRTNNEGDARAEAELFKRLEPRVRAWSARRVRDPAEAADLVQHVMLVILESLRAGRVQEIGQLGGFIHGACKNTLMSWRRGERRREAILEAFGPGIVAAAEAPKIDELALDHQRLVKCFQHLVPRAQSILTLSFFADRSSDEIATELAISVANVRVLKHRATRDLYDCVTREA